MIKKKTDKCVEDGWFGRASYSFVVRKETSSNGGKSNSSHAMPNKSISKIHGVEPHSKSVQQRISDSSIEMNRVLKKGADLKNKFFKNRSWIDMNVYSF